MNQIRLEVVNNLCTLHVGQIQRKTNLIVQWKGKALSMFDFEAKGFFREFLRRCVIVDSQNMDIVASFFHEFEHFLEPIGVSRNVGKGGGFDH